MRWFRREMCLRLTKVISNTTIVIGTPMHCSLQVYCGSPIMYLSNRLVVLHGNKECYVSCERVLYDYIIRISTSWCFLRKVCSLNHCSTDLCYLGASSQVCKWPVSSPIVIFSQLLFIDKISVYFAVAPSINSFPCLFLV